MGRGVCPACGANVDITQDISTGETVPLEVHTDAGGDGAARYRVVSDGPPIQVERVPDNWPGDFFPDHRFDCPDYNAGRTF